MEGETGESTNLYTAACESFPAVFSARLYKAHLELRATDLAAANSSAA